MKNVVSAMLDELSPSAVAELERVLRVRLSEKGSRVEQKRAELDPLTGLLEKEGDVFRGAFMVERQRYDAVRSPGDSSSRTLVKKYGSWREACSLAAAIIDSNRVRRVRAERRVAARKLFPKRWVMADGEERRVRTWTREDAGEAVVRCRRELQRTPSSDDYQRWAQATRERDLGRGASSSVPSLEAIKRLFIG